MTLDEMIRRLESIREALREEHEAANLVWDSYPGQPSYLVPISYPGLPGVAGAFDELSELITALEAEILAEVEV